MSRAEELEKRELKRALEDKEETPSDPGTSPPRS